MASLLSQLEPGFVDRDLNEPGTEFGLATKSRQVHKSLQNSLLRDILGIRGVIQYGHRGDVYRSLVRSDEAVESVSVAFTDKLNKLGFVRIHPWLGCTHRFLIPNCRQGTMENPGTPAHTWCNREVRSL